MSSSLSSALKPAGYDVQGSKESTWYTRLSRLFPQPDIINEDTESATSTDDPYSLPTVLSKTKLIYDELQARRRQIVDSYESVRLPASGLPSIHPNGYEGTLTDGESKPNLTVPTAVEFIRARNKWLKNKPNLRNHADELALNELKKGKKTFITQGDQLATDSSVTDSTQASSIRYGECLTPPSHTPHRRGTHPQTHAGKIHNFWSTVPSTLSQTDQKLKDFINGTVNVVTAYNNTRHGIDSLSHRLLLSAETNTPLQSGVKLISRTRKDKKCKVTPQTIAKNMADLSKMYTDQYDHSFNPAEYKRDATRLGGLSKHVKGILRVESDDRSEADVRAVDEAITRLHCFDNLIQAGPVLTHNVTRELSKSVTLQVFEKGRTILKQGHQPEAFYFIVTGSVGVYKTERDEKGVIWTRHAQSLGQGKTFGEIAFLSELKQKRTASVITSATCELLRVYKDVFEDVLLDAKQEEWAERLAFMQKIPELSGLSEIELKSLNESASLESFEYENVIVGNTKGRQSYVRFVYKGECVLVQEIYVKKSKKLKLRAISVPDCHNPPSQYNLATKEDCTLTDIHTRRLGKTSVMRRKLLHVHKLQIGHYFGAGEDLTDMYIIANRRVVCLTIPTLEFVLKPNLRKVLQELYENVKKTLPTKDALFQKYKEEKKWKKYKQDLVKGVMANKKLQRDKTCQYAQIRRN